MEPCTLKAALKFYCDEDMEDAHDALADVKATVSVIQRATGTIPGRRLR